LERKPDHAASCLPRALKTFNESTLQKRFGAKRHYEWERHMKWIGEYIIDDAGQCRWHEGLRIQDEQMKSAYRKNSLIEFIIETSAVMGVKVGIA
jgi:hypothetical protein